MKDALTGLLIAWWTVRVLYLRAWRRRVERRAPTTQLAREAFIEHTEAESRLAAAWTR